MEDRIKKAIKNLEEILEKYEELNKKTRHKYRYREMAIIDEIETLEDILMDRDVARNWKECYEEDLKESE